MSETEIRSLVVAEAKTWKGTPYVLGGWSRLRIDCRGLWFRVLKALDLDADNGGQLPNVRAIHKSAVERGYWRPVESGYVPEPGDGVIYRGIVPGVGKGPLQIAHIAFMFRVSRRYSFARLWGWAFSALSPKEGTHGHPLNLYPAKLAILGYVALNPSGYVEPPVDDPEEPVAD